MKPIFKEVAIWSEHCPKCKEELSGNNSIAQPWYCKCGRWVYNGEGEYNVIKETKQS